MSSEYLEYLPVRFEPRAILGGAGEALSADTGRSIENVVSLADALILPVFPVRGKSWADRGPRVASQTAQKDSLEIAPV